MFLKKFAIAVLLAAAVVGCGTERRAPLLTLLSSQETGVTFVNRIVEGEGLNVLTYEYFFNGGGVAIGDVNGDGRPDIYFTANMGPNALYMNEGDMRFRDATVEAGLQGGPGWTTGVTMVDINGNGLLDIYVCKSGRVSEQLRRNELYINNGDGTFTERAAEFGLDDPSYSTHAAFFDYDRDGDLDMFLVNHAVERYSRFDVDLMKQMRDPLAGDKLYRNDGGVFVDVTRESGIFGNPIGFGLSAMGTDVNGDGWPDIYVANDYVEDDYLYINNGDGTFTEELRLRLGHTSYSSMGMDIADVNNDGLPDIYTLDMMPQDPVRRKLLQGPFDYERHSAMLAEGYGRQFMRNMLHLNNGNGTFSEIGQLAGVAETDWSWAALFADFDNDGLQDLFVTNGYLRDYTNLDFLVSVLHDALWKSRMSGAPFEADATARQMPQTPVANYLFRNAGGLRFEDRSREWGVDQPAFSNGAAYGDLNGDGSLDLVVNNINGEAFIYRNEARRLTDNRYLAVRLEGDAPNTFGIGSRVELHTPDSSLLVQYLQPGRGYQSSVDPVLHFGVGASERVDVRVTWPDGRIQRVGSVETNRSLTIRRSEIVDEPADPRTSETFPYFVAVPDRLGLLFEHREDDFADFTRDRLLPHMLDRLGPTMATADVNRDGLPDLFLGGARGQAAELYLQQADGTFLRSAMETFEQDAEYEDVAAIFIDANGDGSPDLYVVSGGTEETEDMTVYQDRLYPNSGFGRFERSDALPPMPTSGGAVAAFDYDGDGDLDLFVGGRVMPGRYPLPPRSYLLENRGGEFVDVTPEALRTPGMVSAAIWADVDPAGEGAELILAGEWMPIRVFRREDGDFREVTESAGLGKTHGWWNTLLAVDLNGNGYMDLVAGNRGLNHWLMADENRPVSLFAGDFGLDGGIDPILTYVANGKRYPEPWRDDLLEQIPRLRRTFPDYASYAGATIEEILSPEQVSEALRLDAYEFAASVFENMGDGTFRKHVLPVEAQFAPVNDVLTLDVNQDGLPDLLLAGNNFAARAQWGAYTAGRGTLLINEGGLGFRALPPHESGFFAPGDARRLNVLATPLGSLVVVANNDGALDAFGVNYRPSGLPPVATSD